MKGANVPTLRANTILMDRLILTLILKAKVVVLDVTSTIGDSEVVLGA